VIEGRVVAVPVGAADCAVSVAGTAVGVRVGGETVSVIREVGDGVAVAGWDVIGNGARIHPRIKRVSVNSRITLNERLIMAIGSQNP